MTHVCVCTHAHTFRALSKFWLQSLFVCSVQEVIWQEGSFKNKHTFVNISGCSCSYLISFVLRALPYTPRDLIDDVNRSAVAAGLIPYLWGEKLHWNDSLKGSPEMSPPPARADYEDGVLVKWSRRKVEGSHVFCGEQIDSLSFHSSQKRFS